MIITLVEADVSSNWLGMFTDWRKRLSDLRVVSASLCWSHIHSMLPRPCAGGRTSSKGFVQSCNSTLKYSFLISLFCQSHSIALTLEVGQTQERNKVAWVWQWGLVLYLHNSSENIYRSVSTAAALFQRESSITNLYRNLFLISSHCRL